MQGQRNAPVNGRAAAAIEATRFGLRVFPVAPRGKKPLLRGWQSSATSDPDVAEAIWASRPEANIGVACGGGLIVVDTDTPAGEEAVRELGVAKTATVTTGRGRHFYLRGESRNRTDLLPGVDVRGAGGYVVGPGSLHPSGTEYRWELPPWKVEPAPLPPGLLAILTEKQKRRNSSPLPAAIELGTRNSTLFRLACGLRGISGLGFEECLATVSCANKLRCKSPLDEDEVERIARAATSYDAAPLWVTDPIAFAEDPTLGTKERHLLIALARYCDYEGVCWPGIRQLSAATGMASNTVERATQGLASRSRITVEPRGRRKSKLYRLLDKPEGSYLSTTAAEGGSSVLDGRTPGVAA